MDVVDPSAGGSGEEYEEMMQSISLWPPPRELYTCPPPWPMEFVGQMPLSPSLLMSRPPPSQPLPLPEHPVPMDADNPASGSGDGEDCGPWPVEGMQLFTSCPSPPRALLYSEFPWSTLEFIGHMPASRPQSPVWSASPSLWNFDDELILHPQTATSPAHAGGALEAVPAGTSGYGRNTKLRGYKLIKFVIGYISYTSKIVALKRKRGLVPAERTTDDVLVKSRAKSQVWQHFTKDGARACCKECRKDYAADSVTCGTTRLRRHLEDAHGVLWTETADAQDSGNSSYRRPPEGNNGKAASGSTSIGDAVQHCCLSEEQSNAAANSRGWSKVFSNIPVTGNEEPSKEIYAQKSGSTFTQLEAASIDDSVQHSVSKEPTNNNAAKSRKTSKVWQHFREDGECNHCRNRLAADTAKDGTSSLRRHLKSVHNIIVGPSSKNRKLGCSPPPAASKPMPPPATKIPRRKKRKDLTKEHAAEVLFQSAVAREQELLLEIEKLGQEKAQVVNQATELQFRLEANVAQMEELKAENTALKNQLQDSTQPPCRRRRLVDIPIPKPL